MNGLVIQTAFLGDLFLSIPLLKKIRESRKETLTLLARKGVAAPLLELGLVDQLIEVDKSDSLSWTKAKQEVLSQSYQWVICPHMSVTSALLAWKIKAPLKISFLQWWNFFAFNRRLKKPSQLPDALRQLSLYKGLESNFTLLKNETNPFQNSKSLETVKFNSLSIPSEYSMSLKNKVQLLEGKKKKLVLIAPGSVWFTKQWGVKKYKALVKVLVDEGFTVGVVGSPQEKQIGDEVLGDSSNGKNYCGLTLMETLSLMASAEAIICNDSGAMHLAATVDLPTVSIFGPTVLELGFRPWNTNSIVVQKTLDCRPCGKHGHQSCPIQTHECMTSIEVYEVLSCLRELLDKTKSSSVR